MRIHSKTTRSIAIGAALAGYAVPGVLGWGAAGHEIVATIAQIYTEPVALQRLCQVLNAHGGTNFVDDAPTDRWATSSARIEGDWPCHLASVATWADTYKYSMRWSAPLHYVNAIGDHPSDTCMFPGSDGWAGRPGINVLGGIFNTSNILLDWADGEDANVELAEEALKFIVHFVGDLHMPLHLVGRDRGGNGVEVCWEGRRASLHSVWDGLIIAKAIRQTPYNYTKPLPGGFERVEKNLREAIYDPFVRRIVWEGIEGKWADDLEAWIGCPTGEEQAEREEAGEQSVWATLGDFFLPGWFTRRSANVPSTDTKFICPYHWAKPIHALNCELIWPKDLDSDDLASRAVSSGPRRPRCKRFPHPHLNGFDVENEELEANEVDGEPPYELDNPSYTKPIEERMLLEQFLAQGGIRLAAILNYIFGDGASVKLVY
ncbi:Endonuclease 2 [Leucoagaricus sp. SymC.cos]|nr:Endonuclease 2 [Leucoagaricus sp. SymC.cos]